ncbi:MAG: polyprenyl synthetase family protein [Deltaproteobacteria bacterium]
MNNSKERLNHYIDLINSQLDKLVPESEILQGKIYEAMRYSLLKGGKRIRPVLTLAVCEMFGGNSVEAMPFACAIEMIHTYSLIHDDLPAMDDDDYRRGALTNHKVYGEGIAVLAGDGLLNKSFEVMLSTLNNNADIDRKIKAVQLIANAAGIDGMIGGQVIDIESEGKRIDYETLKNMHTLKTGALISSSAVAGAIIAGASQEDIKRVYEYASNLGLAFQIKDDILSEVGDRAKLGKNTGNDRERSKSTYVTILGLEESQAFLEKVTDKAVNSLEDFGKKAEFLIELANYLLNRDS